jgi:hypothetical protein
MDTTCGYSPQSDDTFFPNFCVARMAHQAVKSNEIRQGEDLNRRSSLFMNEDGTLNAFKFSRLTFAATRIRFGDILRGGVGVRARRGGVGVRARGGVARRGGVGVRARGGVARRGVGPQFGAGP